MPGQGLPQFLLHLTPSLGREFDLQAMVVWPHPLLMAYWTRTGLLTLVPTCRVDKTEIRLDRMDRVGKQRAGTGRRGCPPPELGCSLYCLFPSSASGFGKTTLADSYHGRNDSSAGYPCSSPTPSWLPFPPGLHAHHCPLWASSGYGCKCRIHFHFLATQTRIIAQKPY